MCSQYCSTVSWEGTQQVLTLFFPVGNFLEVCPWSPGGGAGKFGDVRVFKYKTMTFVFCGHAGTSRTGVLFWTRKFSAAAGHRTQVQTWTMDTQNTPPRTWTVWKLRTLGTNYRTLIWTGSPSETGTCTKTFKNWKNLTFNPVQLTWTGHVSPREPCLWLLPVQSFSETGPQLALFQSLS